jgi:dipeptidyl aminopeptidase/acylaminoacyl peptidase
MLRAALLASILSTAACAGAPAPEPCPTPTCPAPAPAAPGPGPGPASAKPAPDSGDREQKLVLQNTPPIPAALRARLDRYAVMRSAVLSGMDARGKTILISTRFAQTYQAHVVRAPLGARQQVTFNREPVRSPSFVPGDDGAVVYMADIGGNEQYQLFHLELASGRTTLLTDGKSRHGAYAWSHDGKRLAYTSNARNGRDMDIYLGDGRGARAGRLFLEREGHWVPLDWSRDGKQLLIAHYISINRSRLFVVDVATKKVTRLTPDKPAASYRGALFDATGRRVYVTTDREGEFVELYEVDLARQRWRPLSRQIRWNVEGLALSPDGRTLAFVTNEEGYGVIHLLDTRTRRHRPLRKIPRGLVDGLRFARGAPVLGMSLLGPDRTAEAYTYDLRRRRLTRWTRSELGGLPPKRFVRPTLIRYKTFDGRQIPAFYYLPRGKGPHPVVVWIHGGPESQARPYFSPLLQYLVVESGIAVVVPNVRGSDGYGKSYLLLDNGYRREDSVRDIGKLLDWIGAQKELDAGRVGVFGGSYGGYMVLASLVHFGARLRAGVDIVGISNFVTFLRNTKAYRRDLRRAEYGDERDKKMHDFLQRISPSNNVSKIRSALFVAQGANDPRVPLSESDQIVAAVRRQGKDVWYMVARDEGHGFRKRRNRDVFYLLTVLFFDKHLKR